jgi:hypothetical protein
LASDGCPITFKTLFFPKKVIPYIFDMLVLKYVAGAIPSKILKRKIEPVQINDNSPKRKYKDHRKQREFNQKWKKG